MTSISLDDDDDFGVSWGPLSPLPPLSKEQGVFCESPSQETWASSTLERKKEEDFFFQSSPSLEPPASNAVWQVVQFQNGLEEQTKKITDIFGKDAKELQEEIETLSEKMRLELKKEAEAALKKDTWDTLARVAEYIAGVTSILVGASLGGVPGALLLFSGGIGLLKRTLEDVGLTNQFVSWCYQTEELQQRLLTQIEIGTLCVQVGLGLAGGLYQLSKTGSIFLKDSLKNAPRAIATAASIASAATNVGKSYHDKIMKDHSAQSRLTKALITESEHAFLKKIRQLQESAELISRAGDVSSSLIQGQVIVFN